MIVLAHQVIENSNFMDWVKLITGLELIGKEMLIWPNQKVIDQAEKTKSWE